MQQGFVGKVGTSFIEDLRISRVDGLGISDP